jgi:CheY-like chemotaxis protein
MTRRAGDVVVVIEDDHDTREAFEDVLRLSGYEVLAAENGRRALELLRSSPALRPCIILLDIMMPEMNGWEFLEQQRRDPALASIPVVVVSADTSAQARAAGQNIAGFLKKPIALDALSETLERYC